MEHDLRLGRRETAPELIRVQDVSDIMLQFATDLRLREEVGLAFWRQCKAAYPGTEPMKPMGEPRSLRGIVLPLASFALLGSVVAAFWVGSFLLVFYALIFATGSLQAAFFLSPIKMRATFGIVALGVSVAAYLFVKVHSLGYAGVYTPEEALLGILNHDTTIHNAIANMIQNFGVPSIGLDGILPMRYHFASHIWYAALGIMTGAEPAWSYGAGVPIVGAPLLLTCLIISAVAMDQARHDVASYLLVGFAMLVLSDIIGWNSYYISESYTFGLIGLLLLLPLLAEFARVGPTTSFMVWGLVMAIVAIPILMLFKTSVGILWCAAFGWIVLRRFGISRVTVIVGIAAVIALTGIWFQVSPGVEGYRRSAEADLSIWPFYFFVVYPEVATYSSLLLPACLLLLRITGTAGKSLSSVLLDRRDLMLEAVILVTILGSIPPLIGIPQDSAVWYFFNVAQWMAMALLIVRLVPDDPRRLAAPLLASRLFAPALLSVTYLFLLYSQTLYTRTLDTMGSMVVAADKIVDGKLLEGRSAARYFVRSLLSQGAILGADFREALASSVGNQVRQTVHEMAGHPRRDLAVFIPPTNTAFWTLHPFCREKHNVQVALTGRPSLFGGIPASYKCARDAYVEAYGEGYQSRDGLTDAELCGHANERGISRVLILTENRSGGQNRLLDCSTRH